MKIVLVGNPNVGKSALFYRLTGTSVIISNYPGTTVEFTKGKLRLKGEDVELIDAPGVYSLEPHTKAEEVAAKLLEESDLVINVVDSTRLERGLYLTFQLLEARKPLVLALNLWDEAKHMGIDINAKKLEELLGVPVVTTVAVTGEGVKQLVERLEEAKGKPPKLPEHAPEQRWAEIMRVVQEVQKLKHRHHTLAEKLNDISISPLSGSLLALFVIVLTALGVFWVGESVKANILDPVFSAYLNALEGFGEVLERRSFLHELLIGEGDPMESMGLLTTGLYVPFVVVLPFVFAFYLFLGLLEDSGYLPRLATLADSIFHRLGLHGAGVVPLFLALGCNVPGVLATRILEERRQRLIAAALMAICVPCTAQLAVVLGVVGEHGLSALLVFFLTLSLIAVSLGVVMNRLLPGQSPEIFLEIPPYRLPRPKLMLTKLWFRIKGFLRDALPFLLLGVLLANLLYTSRLLNGLADLTSPLVSGLFGLPKEAVLALLLGFLRKDVAVGMLTPLELDAKQSVVACIILVLYFPCVATFVVLAKELGIKEMSLVAGLMLLLAASAAFTLNSLLCALPTFC